MDWCITLLTISIFSSSGSIKSVFVILCYDCLGVTVMLPIKYYVYVLNNCVLTGHSCEEIKLHLCGTN